MAQGQYDNRQLWDEKASFWDAMYGDKGNRFHQTLVIPTLEHLLNLQPDERILDVACGPGATARHLAALGGVITAVDFSPIFIEKAKARGQSSGHPIDYRVVDATDETALVALGVGQFDALVCTMAFMDMAQIAPLFRAAYQLLKPDGRFVFVTAHPAFNSNFPVMLVEVDEENGQQQITHALKVKTYLDQAPRLGMGAPNEPTPHIYYHRPLHQLLGDAFAAAFVLDALEEPAFDPAQAPDGAPVSWYHFGQIPPVLAGRLRPQSRR